MARPGAFKIFVGNLNEKTENRQLRGLFQNYGTVMDAVVIKNFGFVHMRTAQEGLNAIQNLHGYKLHGKTINVAAAYNRQTPNLTTTKFFIGNLTASTRATELCEIFEKFGTVVECEILPYYSFVHLNYAGEVQTILDALNGYKLHGKPMKVRVATSHINSKAGNAGGLRQCYRCHSYTHNVMRCPHMPGPHENYAGYYAISPLPPQPPVFPIYTAYGHFCGYIS